MRTSTLRSRLPLVFAIAATLVLTGAFAFEKLLDWPPCPLCLWQRWPYAAIMALGVLGMWPKLRRLALGGILIASLISLGLAVFHVGVEHGWWQGLTTCAGNGTIAADSVDLLAQLATTRPVSCTDPAGYVLGLSLAAWNSLVSVVFLGYSSLLLLRKA
jgi:disulfide bond formation protein DsbB